MRQLLHFWGLRRSGNHAILNWILANIAAQDSETFFVNSILERPQFFAQMPRVVSTNKCLTSVISYEDCDLSHSMSMLTVVKESIVMPNSQYRHIILLRDPFNAFASRKRLIENRVKNGGDGGVFAPISWSVVVHLWKQCAREYLGETNYLMEKKISISYNSWVVSREYRDSLMQTIGFQNMDLKKEYVPPNGEGSSFDLRSKDGNASSMELFDRWRMYQDDPSYVSLFEDEELISLSNAIFGHMDGTEVLFDRASK